MDKNPKNIELLFIHLIVYCVLGALVLMNFNIILDFIGNFIAICLPFILGAGLAFVFNIISNGLMKYANRFFHIKDTKGKRVVANISAIFIFFLVIFGFVFLVSPQLVASVQKIAAQGPSAVNQFYLWLIEATRSMPPLHDKIMNFYTDLGDESAIVDMVMNFFNWLASGFGSDLINSIYSAVTMTVSVVASTVIAIVFSVILLFNKQSFVRQVKKLFKAYLKPSQFSRLIYTVRIVQKTFTSYIAGTAFECMILGSLVMIACTIFRIPYAMLSGIIVAIGALVPWIGAFISALFCTVFIATESLMSALTFIIVFVIIQQIEGNFIYPNVVGKSVGLPSMYVLMAVTIGGSLAGIAGMVVFIPISSCVYQILRQDVNKRLEEKNSEVST